MAKYTISPERCGLPVIALFGAAYALMFFVVIGGMDWAFDQFQEFCPITISGWLFR